MRKSNRNYWERRGALHLLKYNKCALASLEVFQSIIGKPIIQILKAFTGLEGGVVTSDSTLYKQEIMLIDGRRLIIKEAEETEANELISFISAVCGESKFLTFGPGEYKIRNIDEIKLIRAYRESDYQALLIGRVQNEIVGHLAFRSGILQRLRHIGEVGISVSKKNWGIGIGTSLMNALLDWAKKTRVIRKVKLRVRSDNHRAIAVYKKIGFIEEKSIIWGFYDNLVMGRSFNQICELL